MSGHRLPRTLGKLQHRLSGVEVHDNGTIYDIRDQYGIEQAYHDKTGINSHR